ncbi:ABC transporter substrate-binding protein [Roseomonas gilardii]|uniref:ABC transporter substrate-binding protein n=1 Tax=Roseomonas gilardii TaxID=257708 RepID=UPI001643EDED|nr:ABC transporter substrate-binding protein [Roseomonas gilardii]
MFLSAAAPAQELRLGIALEPTSLDPHFHAYGAAMAMSRQIFEPLLTIGEDGQPKPLLAAAWTARGNEGWEFELREDARFSDGAPLTPDDVVFTFQRAPNVPNSPTGFGSNLRAVTGVEILGPHRILVRTDGPAPMLPRLLSNIFIVSRHAGEGATTADYNSTKSAIGTGPYRVTGWDRGAGISLVRNERYSGAAPEWRRVNIRYIPNAAARVGALRAGDVDLIDQVSAQDLPALQASSTFNVTSSVSYAVVGLLPDVTERAPPYITGNDGQPLERNPLADVRVRRALELAINREALVKRVMSDQVVAATQIMLPGQYGYDPSLPPPAQDLPKARTLLAEAGYPEGFRIAIHCQQRFYNADAMCQAIAQMLTRIGLRAEPVPIPHPMYVTRSIKHEFSLGTTYPLVDLGDPSTSLIANSATYGGANGWGNSNRGRYSNPVLDALLDRSQREINVEARETMLRQAMHIVADDVAMIPLFRPKNLEAMRADLQHQPGADGYVLAADIHRR